MLLLLDNRDSFTWNLVQAFQALGEEVEVVRSDRVRADEVLAREPSALVVGPGPGAPEGAGCSLEVLRRVGPEVPVLGVCLGHQAIAVALGGRLRRAREPVHGRATPTRHAGAGVFAGLPSPLAVARYHSLVVDEASLPACLEVTARADDGEVMGLRHRERPVEGVQFHPESVLAELGQRMLASWLHACRQAAPTAATAPSSDGAPRRRACAGPGE